MADMRTIRIDIDVHRALENAREAFDETENVILRRVMKLPALAEQERHPAVSASPRARGRWEVRIKNEKTPAANLREAYRILLERLDREDPMFLLCLSELGTSSRAYVAKNSSDIYKKSPHLALKHAQLLVNGWYYDTNVSESQVRARLAAIARAACLKAGEISIGKNTDN